MRVSLTTLFPWARLEAHIEIERRPIDKNVHALVKQLLRGALLAHLKHKRANLWHLDKQVEDSFVFQQIHTQVQVGNGRISVCDGIVMSIVVAVDEMHSTSTPIYFTILRWWIRDTFPSLLVMSIRNILEHRLNGFLEAMLFLLRFSVCRFTSDSSL